MKKHIPFICLLIALFPCPGFADESTVTEAERFPVAEAPVQVYPDLSEETAKDEELLRIVGHGLGDVSTLLPEVSGRSPSVCSRIKLWDEAHVLAGKISPARYGAAVDTATLSVLVKR